MVTTLGLLYMVAVIVLFFFWAYGIYAFFRDLKRSFIPKFRQYRRGRKRLSEETDPEDELDEDQEQLL